MSRFKPLLFVIGLSLVSAVSLRLLLGRAVASLNPDPVSVGTARVDSAELARRMVGCGHFRFVFDSLGYRTGQWPDEVDATLAARRVDATFLARDGWVRAVIGPDRGPEIGDFVIRADTVYLTLGPEGTGLRARLAPVGDSLGGRMERAAGAVVGRLFVGVAAPMPTGCSGP